MNLKTIYALSITILLFTAGLIAQNLIYSSLYTSTSIIFALFSYKLILQSNKKKKNH